MTRAMIAFRGAMKMSKRTIGIAAWVTALVVFGLGLSPARADVLVVGGLYTGEYTSSIVMDNTATPSPYLTSIPWNSAGQAALAGGSIDPSSLNGTPLPYLYCVDIPDDVFVGQTYYGAVVTSNGDDNSNGVFGVQGAQVFNAGEVAWLLDNHGVDGVGTDAAVALQAAIWHVIYGITLDPAANNADYPTAYSLYTNDLAGLGVAPVSDVLWISPDASGTVDQGLVSRVSEPSSVLLLGLLFTGVLGSLGLMKRRLA